MVTVVSKVILAVLVRISIVVVLVIDVIINVELQYRRTCTYNAKDLDKRLSESVEKQLPLPFIRKVARHAFRYMDAYRIGLVESQARYAVKKYSSHRRIPRDVYAMDVAKNFFQKQTKVNEDCLL